MSPLCFHCSCLLFSLLLSGPDSVFARTSQFWQKIQSKKWHLGSGQMWYSLTSLCTSTSWAPFFLCPSVLRQALPQGSQNPTVAHLCILSVAIDYSRKRGILPWLPTATWGAKMCLSPMHSVPGWGPWEYSQPPCPPNLQSTRTSTVPRNSHSQFLLWSSFLRRQLGQGLSPPTPHVPSS